MCSVVGSLFCLILLQFLRFSTRCLLGLAVAPNFASCSFGLPFLSVSNASLQMLSYIEMFSRGLEEHIATNKFQLGFAIPVYFLCSLQKCFV
jgi:hypothetical protein